MAKKDKGKEPQTEKVAFQMELEVPSFKEQGKLQARGEVRAEIVRAYAMAELVKGEDPIAASLHANYTLIGELWEELYYNKWPKVTKVEEPTTVLS